jgi:hypothetical protein
MTCMWLKTSATPGIAATTLSRKASLSGSGARSCPASYSTSEAGPEESMAGAITPADLSADWLYGGAGRVTPILGVTAMNGSGSGAE